MDSASPTNPVIWEGPSASRRSKGTPAIAPNQIEQLKANPNEWGRIGSWGRPTVAGTCRSQLAKGEGGIPMDEVANYEFRAERTDDGSKLYARYIG